MPLPAGVRGATAKSLKSYSYTARDDRAWFGRGASDLAATWGFIVEEARYAAEAVEKARTRLPDLIVMDLAVPVRHGRQAREVLASDPSTAAVPVLASNPQAYAVIPHASKGAEGFQPRPANPDHLLVQIRDTFRRGARTSQRHA